MLIKEISIGQLGLEGLASRIMLAVVGGGFLVWFNIRIDGGLAGTELQCWGALDLSEIWPGSTIPASATLQYKKLEQNGVDLFLYVSKNAESVKRERERRCVIQCFDSVGTDWLARSHTKS